MIFVNLAGFVGRIVFSILSDTLGRRISGGIFGFGAAIVLVLAALEHDVFIAGMSVFWLLLIATNLFADGGFAIVGPYAAEVWPSTLRTTGMGSAYGFGGIGKVIGPLGLALIVGSTNIITPEASVAAIVPAYIYVGSWFALAGVVFLFFGMETKGRSFEDIEDELGAVAPVAEAAADYLK
jgi:putative MFS transporter